MSPTTTEKLEIDPLPHPEGASGGLNALIDAVEEHINRSILLLASGDPGSAPDFAAWLDQKGLPGEDDLDKPNEHSTMVEKYTSRQQDVRDLTTELDQKNKSINDSQVAAFDTSNGSYQNIKSIVSELRQSLSAPRQLDDVTHRLPPAAEADLLIALLDAVDRVHDEVETAANNIDTHAREIDGSAPVIPARYQNTGGWGGGGGGGGGAGSNGVVPVSSNVGYVITNPNDPGGSAVELARSQLGVAEYADNRVNAPYNINDEWCASFTSWAWKEAGYDVDWTNKNYVPAIWSDARVLDLQATAGEAVKGDLIIIDWKNDGHPDHIGIVDRVENGRIYTIEGNSGKAVREQDYAVGDARIHGIVKQPSTGSQRTPGETAAMA